MQNPVAQFAVPGAPNRKQASKLMRRRTDYSLMMADPSDRTGRKGSGGYHRPGSNKK